MNNNKDLREVLKEKANKDTIMKYMFINELRKKYEDQYIQTMYGINIKHIELRYKVIDENSKKEITTEIKEKIDSGEIDLNREAINWHRESLKQKAIKEQNSKKSIRREEH